MFYASMYLDILTNNELNICSHDIYMAWKQNGIGLNGAGGYQGLNVNATSTGNVRNCAIPTQLKCLPARRGGTRSGASM